jgi:hypothetical protein
MARIFPNNRPDRASKRVIQIMKAILLKTTAVLVALAGTSCMTTYDAYGRPVQTVDPGAAAAGIAAAGLIGYAVGQHNDHHHGHYHYYPRYYGPYGCY